MSEKIIEFLKEDLNKKKEKNKRFSLRSYAKQIGIEHSTLSKLFSGKRNMTFDLANKILTNLNVQSSIKNGLILTLIDDKNFSQNPKDEEFIILSDQEMQEMLQWHYHALITYFGVPHFDRTKSAAARFFNLSMETVQNACDILFKCGVIKYDGETVISDGVKFATQLAPRTSAHREAWIKKMQGDFIQQSLESLNGDVDKSYFGGGTVSIPVEKFDEAERRIKEFIRTLFVWLDEDTVKRNDVYRMNVQFFPMRKVKK